MEKPLNLTGQIPSIKKKKEKKKASWRSLSRVKKSTAQQLTERINQIEKLRQEFI